MRDNSTVELQQRNYEVRYLVVVFHNQHGGNILSIPLRIREVPMFYKDFILSFFFFYVEEILPKTPSLQWRGQVVSDSYRLKPPRWPTFCTLKAPKPEYFPVLLCHLPVRLLFGGCCPRFILVKVGFAALTVNARPHLLVFRLWSGAALFLVRRLAPERHPQLSCLADSNDSRFLSLACLDTITSSQKRVIAVHACQVSTYVILNFSASVPRTDHCSQCVRTALMADFTVQPFSSFCFHSCWVSCSGWRRIRVVSTLVVVSPLSCASCI